MNRFASLALGAMLTGLPLFAPAVFAESAIVATKSEATFYVAGMTCPLCPVTVKAAISDVDGVTSVDIDLAARLVRVVFDPSLTNAAAIAHASEQAGYPADLQG